MQNIDDIATEVYIGGRFHKLEHDDGRDFDDVFAVLSGARIKF